MENSGTGTTEDRINALENRFRDMDALVKGLLNELLDLKTIFTKLSRQAGNYRSPEYVPEPDVQETVSQRPAPFSSDGSVLIQPKSASRPDVLATPAEPEMVRIMQSDGTMKMEVRRGDQSMTSGSGGYGGNKKSTSLRSKKTS